MKLIYLILFLTMLFACQKKADTLQLQGHWHIYYPDSTFGSWDIIDSLQVIIDKNTFWGYYPIIGYDHLNIDPENQDTVVLAYFSEYINYLPYRFVHDTLFLSDNSYGIKVDTSKCDLQEEFFGSLYVDIALPHSRNAIDMWKVISEKSLISHIDIGKPRKHLKQYPPDTFLIQVNNVFIGYDQIVDYVEREQSKLPIDERDSIIFAFSVDKLTPAVVADSIEHIINSSFPFIKIFYACLPGEKQYLKESVFSSLKNKFAKPADKPTVSLNFSIYPGGQVKWYLQKTSKRIALPSYSLQSVEGKERLKGITLDSEQAKQSLGIKFNFVEEATFQDYITAQATINQIIEKENIE